MNTCKTCKWWAYRGGTDLYKQRDCNNPKLENEDGADTLSAGEASSALCRPTTGPDFGCIHWEAK